MYRKFRKDKIRNNIIKQKINLTRSLLEVLRLNNLNSMDMFNEWKRGTAKKSYEMEPTRKKKTR